MTRPLQYQIIPFGPFVMKTKIPEDMRKRLLRDGKKELVNYNKNLAGHLKSQFLYGPETTKWFYKESNFIWQAYREGWSKWSGRPNVTLELNAISLWVNFMKPGDFNPVHTHTGDYSFVIFLDVPKQIAKEQYEYEGTSNPPGSIQFEFTQHARPQWAITGHAILPETGDMLIFPAMLQHWVCPFKSKCTRVSVSGNLEITNRKELHQGVF